MPSPYDMRMKTLTGFFLAALLSPSAWAQMPVAPPVAEGYEAPVRDVTIYDPWERYNRRVHTFNRKVDQYVAKPLAKGYRKVVPQPLRNGVNNFFVNIFQPISAVHLLLQGRPKPAAAALGRFTLNATLGVGGLFDPATDANIPLRREDLGQTLAVWGWKNSRYFELPFLGPSTVRDTFGFIGDSQASPFSFAETPERYYASGLYLVNLRAGALAGEKLVRGGEGDDYLLIRDPYLQARDFQIHDRTARDELPDYLQSDDVLGEDE